MMLAALSSLEDQGIYSLAANYGGLIARIIFQPLEESSRNLFSALLTSNEKKDYASTRASSAGSDEEEETNSQQIRTAKSHLITLLKAYQLLSILVLPIGPIMVPTLLKILGGRQWTSNKVSDLLSLYCYYIPFLAFNGITEAFVSSAADPSEIRTQTLWMGVFSACYALAAYIFLEVASLGAYGLVCANIVNMAVRTIWSFGFIRGFLKKKNVGLRLGEICMMPTSYGLLGLATVLSQMVHSLRENILEAIAFSAVYGLLM